MILAIDCGSTNHKAALFDEGLRRLADCALPVAYAASNEQTVEFDPGQVWRDTVGLIRQLCAMASISTSQIKTIALAGQAQTFTLLDGAGRPLMPFISWQDKRAGAESRELAERMGADFHRHCSFPAPMPQLQLSKLIWIRYHRPDRLRNAASVASLPGFLARRLAGLDAMDDNLAAMTGMYSLALHDWRPAALEICGLTGAQMGPLTRIGSSIPAAAGCDEIKFAPELEVVFAGNDQTAGAFAAGGRESPVLTLGTALAVYRYAGAFPGPYHAQGCWGPYPGGGYYELAARDEGCAALDWAVDRVMPGARAAFMAGAATAAPGAAFFYPERIRTAGAWTGASDPAARARAVLEGICFSARQLMEEGLQMPLPGAPLTVAGGGSANSFWLQMLADICGGPVFRSAHDALLGAAIMARQDAEPSGMGAVRPILPDPGMAADYAGIYRTWRGHQRHS